ncbi:hypothetical protein [Pseudomonas anguilliseptica]|uniref:Helix-hairpin-helix domain-containing protein n=1 Tax=Pseudomonas anguilliseptica TaxID=53406 RepID=A0A1H5F3U8_PSEAG|nr:hypothetical protein [Pseudomonas anguilliseptica]SED97970.1 hypothetical protein SAMN05421553_3772 [Pseudomonas anguilliseptica]
MGFLSTIKSIFGANNISGKSSNAGQTAAEISRMGLNDDGFSTLEFCATLQLRTPLEALNYHRVSHPSDGTPPPYEPAMANGIWIPVVAPAFAALRTGTTTASDIGPIPFDDTGYVSFLKIVRSIVEKRSSIDGRRRLLQEELTDDRWASYVSAHGGSDFLINRFFPPFVSTISGLSVETQDSMIAIGLTTPRLITEAADDTLLSLKGVGPAKLQTIRAACIASGNPDSTYTAASALNVSNIG